MGAEIAILVPFDDDDRADLDRYAEVRDISPQEIAREALELWRERTADIESLVEFLGTHEADPPTWFDVEFIAGETGMSVAMAHVLVQDRTAVFPVDRRWYYSKDMYGCLAEPPDLRGVT